MSVVAATRASDTRRKGVPEPGAPKRVWLVAPERMLR